MTLQWERVETYFRGDTRGSMAVLENVTSKLKIERTFWLTNDSDVAVQRGNHAHRFASQLFFCGLGTAELLLESLDGEREIITLNWKSKALLVRPMVWAHVGLEPGTTLTVMSDWGYDEEEYIRDKMRWLQTLKIKDSL